MTLSMNQEAFLAAYREVPIVGAAAKLAGVHRNRHHEWQQNPEYAAAWEVVKVEAANLKRERSREAARNYVHPAPKPRDKSTYRQANSMERKPGWEQRREQRLQNKYGISHADYERMYQEQDGCCYLCGDEYPVLCIDHCHISGRVRRLLCSSCNRNLGHIENDVPKAKRMLVYIEEWGNQW